MGIGIHVHSMAMRGWMVPQHGEEPGEQEHNGTELEEELRAGKIKFNDLMRDGVTARLDTIVARANREFTNEMLGHPKDRGTRILDVRA